MSCALPGFGPSNRLCTTVTVYLCDCDCVPLWRYHCYWVPLWLCTTVTVCHCDCVPLSLCATVTVYHCYWVPLWLCTTVTGCHCHCVPLQLWLYRCYCVPLWLLLCTTLTVTVYHSLWLWLQLLAVYILSSWNNFLICYWNYWFLWQPKQQEKPGEELTEVSDMATNKGPASAKEVEKIMGEVTKQVGAYWVCCMYRSVLSCLLL